MAVSLTVERVGTSAAPDQFTVTWTATDATEIPLEVFLRKFSDESFVRVVTPADIVYPTTKTPGQAFYRTSTVAATYATQATADAQIVQVGVALTDLVTAYKNGMAQFTTPVSTVYT